MFGLHGQELLFIALIVLLLFGGKKIPEMMKGLGKGVRSFKDGINGKEDSDKDNHASESISQPSIHQWEHLVLNRVQAHFGTISTY